jgi:D-sedoheptulose 7-phosphate isomerase
MNQDRMKLIEDAFTESARLHERVLRERGGAVLAAAEAVGDAFRRGNKVLVFGNGGSAADSQHFAAEIVGRFSRERLALPVIALTTDTSALTAIGNDYGFDRVFARQVEAVGRKGDVAIGISTSGASRNVVAAFGTARAAGLTTIALTGRDGGVVGAAADVHVNVPSPATPRVQEVHRTILHVICELVEQGL